MVLNKTKGWLPDTCRFERTIYTDWTSSVGEVSELNLDLPLLTRMEESKLISVNFDPQVCATAYTGDKRILSS